MNAGDVGPISLKLEHLPLEYIDGRDWLITGRFVYRLGDREVVIEPNTPTDFASVPWVLRRVLPPAGDGPRKAYGKAAALHDQLYRTGRYCAGGARCTQAEADRVLLEAMRELDVIAWARWTIYAGVRAFGWFTWRRYRRLDVLRLEAEIVRLRYMAELDARIIHGEPDY